MENGTYSAPNISSYNKGNVNIYTSASYGYPYLIRLVYANIDDALVYVGGYQLGYTSSYNGLSAMLGSVNGSEFYVTNTTVASMLPPAVDSYCAVYNRSTGRWWSQSGAALDRATGLANFNGLRNAPCWASYGNYVYLYSASEPASAQAGRFVYAGNSAKHLYVLADRNGGVSNLTQGLTYLVDGTPYLATGERLLSFF